MSARAIYRQYRVTSQETCHPLWAFRGRIRVSADPDDTITIALKLIDAKTGSVRFKAVPGDTLQIKPITVQKTELKPDLK